MEGDGNLGLRSGSLGLPALTLGYLISPLRGYASMRELELIDIKTRWAFPIEGRRWILLDGELGMRRIMRPPPSPLARLATLPQAGG